jgi:antitoxin component of RelBE/YafQ-DinJ toxin-antitoxin module
MKISPEVQEAAQRVADEYGMDVKDVLAQAERIVRGER